LRDGREIWLGGERVVDVTAHPLLRGAALTIAALYALQHRPDLQDRLSLPIDGSGERIGYSHIQPRTRDDLRRRREMIKLWADENGGMLGRTPDFKDLAKAEFLLGLAYNLAESINVLQFPNVQNNIREMITVTEMVRAAVLAAESDPVPGPGGTLVPNPRYLGQERFYFLESFPRLLEIVRILGAGGLMMTPSDADVRGPLAPDIERYYQAAALPADRRIGLFALANDAACSGFAGRNVLYERFFAGDPWRVGSLAATRYPWKDELQERIWAFLRRAREWDET
jgi:aromatic ring hydroxylase